MRLILVLLLTLSLSAVAFEHFEARSVHPIAITPNGRKLLVLHSTTHQLSVFDLGEKLRSEPLLVREIPISTTPVSVRARTDSEAWVVNEVSDSVSVVDLDRGLIVATLRTGDEPADVVFAGGKAFVSCSQAREVVVFDTSTRVELGRVPINFLTPRAMCVSNDQKTVYVASLYSGNGTTVLSKEKAPEPPVPTNPELPKAPKTALIVAADDPRVTADLPDRDIAKIDVNSLTVTGYVSGVGTHLFDIAVGPAGDLFCANSESLNLTRFEPELNGDFTRHRLTKVGLDVGEVSRHFDLNPGHSRQLELDPASIAVALAQPTSLAFTIDGKVWVTAFNSDRVALVDWITGTIEQRVDLRTEQKAGLVRGPRAAVLSRDGSQLYVYNKLSDTLGTVRTETGTLISETPVASSDPMPDEIRAGRGLLYDARLSGNGTMSCATCHLDADRDGLAWDLGDPGGEITSVAAADLGLHDFSLINRTLHPMKGPLTTQTLRGLALNDASPVDPTSGEARPAEAIVTKFHWRGDKPSIQSFNSTFPQLMGGSLLSAEQMDQMAAYLLSIRLHPNPFRRTDRTLATEVRVNAAGVTGDATNGLVVFNDHLKSHCIVCHDFNGGTDQNLDDFASVGSRQPMKNPGFRSLYPRVGIFNPDGESLAGFGLGSDGTGHKMPIVHPYGQDRLDRLPLTEDKLRELNDLTAFLLSFDTGTAPTVGHDLTVSTFNRGANQVVETLDLLERDAERRWIALVVWGEVEGVRQSFQFDPEQKLYVRDQVGEVALSRTDLLSEISGEDVLTFSGVHRDEIGLRGGDRDRDGTPNRSEKVPKIEIGKEDGNQIYLKKVQAGWVLEAAETLEDGIPWRVQEGSFGADEVGGRRFLLPSGGPDRQFFRLVPTW